MSEVPGPLSYAALKAHLDSHSDLTRPEDRIYIYHAHTHFKLDDQEVLDDVINFKKKMQERFSPLQTERFFYGHTHTKPVGPHPEGQFELVFSRPDYAEIINWLALSRPASVSILIHAHTPDAVEDHTHRALWLGSPNRISTGVLEVAAQRWKRELAAGKSEAVLLWGDHK